MVSFEDFLFVIAVALFLTSKRSITSSNTLVARPFSPDEPSSVTTITFAPTSSNSRLHVISSAVLAPIITVMVRFLKRAKSSHNATSGATPIPPATNIKFDCVFGTLNPLPIGPITSIKVDFDLLDISWVPLPSIL